MTKEISRRTILKGLGVSMCLPWLESTSRPAWANEKSVGKTEAKPNAGDGPPIRLAALYMPNGVNPKAWTPEGTGQEWKLSPILEPLANVKSDILVLTELMNKASIEGDGHYVKVAPWLTGTAITKTTGSELRSGGVSLDQMVAQRIGNLTPLPSLELSVEPVTMGVDTNVGFTRLYGSHISWSTPTTPVAREINPQLAFDRLFRPRAQRTVASIANDASVLDAVKEEAKSLRGQIGGADKAKLDEYFDSIRAVEKRIAFDAARRKAEMDADPQSRQAIEKLGGRLKDYYSDPARQSERSIDHTEQVRLMMDVIALAFWTDATRVATFMFGNEVSGKNFSFLDGVNGGHHQISHHENDAAKIEQYQKINIWHIQQYAYLLEKLKSIKEGNGTLLDNCMVLFGSGMKDGNAHSPHNLPVILAGSAGGQLATGRHLVYEKKTPLCNLYRTMLSCIGTPQNSFGDSTSELVGLRDANWKSTI
ncbi:MAG TPA: DUF1552 domain-containing protein [Abditibacteriaceae bacterium]